MGRTIDQPKPSQPHSPVPDQQPLSPGSVESNPLRSAPSTRVNPQDPDIIKEEREEPDVHNR